MDPIKWWRGTGGNEYTVRNRVDWRLREAFWSNMMRLTHQQVRSVFEVGCNAGWNLSAIGSSATCGGCDVNEVAVDQALAAGLHVDVGTALKVLPLYPVYDLVFTCGVLIHQPTRALNATMRAIIQASTRYVLAIEYEGEVEEEVPYRGQDGLLWRRPYGEMYAGMGLKLLSTSKRLSKDEGFDDCAYWLMEKP